MTLTLTRQTPEYKLQLRAAFAARKAQGVKPWSLYQLETLSGIKSCQFSLVLTGRKRWRMVEELLDAIVSGASLRKIRAIVRKHRQRIERERSEKLLAGQSAGV